MPRPPVLSAKVSQEMKTLLVLRHRQRLLNYTFTFCHLNPGTPCSAETEGCFVNVITSQDLCVKVEESVRGCCFVDGLCTEDDGSGRVDQSWSSVNNSVASP